MSEQRIKPYKVAIVGSRDYHHLENVKEVVDKLLPSWVVVTGGARGVDQAAERAARARGMQVQVILPDWQQHGKAAGPIRNRQIVDAADMIIAFWDLESPGTKSTIDYALHRKPIKIYEDKPLAEIRREALEYELRMQALLIGSEEEGRKNFEALAKQLMEEQKAEHERHVQAGNCPAISLARAWCCKPAGHLGLHGSPRVPNPSQPKDRMNPSYVEWRE